MNDLKEEQVKKWGVLVDDLEENQMPEVALLLENQRLFNERDQRHDTDFKWPEEAGYKDLFELFTRVSIPMVRRIYGNGLWPLFKIVSVQATPSPGFVISYEDLKGRLIDTPSAVRLRNLVTEFAFADVENEGDQVAKWAEDISLEIVREVFNDLRLNAGVIIDHEWSSSTKLAVALLSANGEVERRVGSSATWIATSPDLADELTKNMDFEESEEGTHEFYKGRLANKWDLFVDPLAVNDVTVGFKGSEHQAGYFYCPYIPLSFLEGGHLVTRYSKKLVPGGENYYVTIQVHNYSPTEEENDG